MDLEESVLILDNKRKIPANIGVKPLIKMVIGGSLLFVLYFNGAASSAASNMLNKGFTIEQIKSEFRLERAYSVGWGVNLTPHPKNFGFLIEKYGVDENGKNYGVFKQSIPIRIASKVLFPLSVFGIDLAYKDYIKRHQTYSGELL
ncbi:hypothetical protein HQ533_01905 [Candidatus Woesearchaeota archaeon]|nr:hypothetical protein [Candidatus Woesearchaeota archaeon]